MAGQRVRAMRAATGIALAIAALAVSGTICEWATGAGAASKALLLSGAEGERELPDEPSGLGFVDARLADGASGVSLAGEAVGREAVPPWFEQELFSLDGVGDIRVSGAGDVVGFVVSSDGEEPLNRFRSALQQDGWVESRTGVEGCSVFVKEEGACRWAMVSCVPVGNATSVVVRCVVDQTRS